MSLGIAFKGPEGIVLAVDSRVTLNAVKKLPDGNQVVLPSTFDHATKLLTVADQDHVAAVTYGLGAINTPEGPRAAHSFLPEFEAELRTSRCGRLTVLEFAQRLSDFFSKQISSHVGEIPPGNDMVFLIGGYDKGEPYGRVFEIFLPSSPQPTEKHPNSFGGTWGGQRQIVDRILNGSDDLLLSALKDEFELDDSATLALNDKLKQKVGLPIPYAFLPLQDTVDLATLLIRTTINAQRWVLDIRGVGGHIDVVTITRTDGVRSIQKKEIHGEQ